MSKAKNCEVCGDPSGKRSVCKKCKDDFPYEPAAPRKLGGGNPFNRKELRGKQK
jgi:hypothetical protein